LSKNRFSVTRRRRPVTPTCNPPPTAAAKQQIALHRVSECLYRTDCSIYYAILKVSGKQIKRSLRTSDRALARKRLAELRRQSYRLNPAAEMTFESVSAQWLEFLRSRGMKPASYQRRVVAVRSLSDRIGDKPVRHINRLHLERWAVRRSRACSARTYNIELETLKQIFTYAVEHGFVIESSAADLKRRRQPKPVITIPSKEQFKMLVADLRLVKQSQKAADFAEFLAYSGCRQHEASEIVWGEVDFTRKTLTISGGSRGTKNGLIRAIPLFPPLERLLVVIQDKTTPTPEPEQKVFSISDIRTALANACRRLGLPKWGHHAFRHFFASNAVEAGVDFMTVAGWLGHRDGGALLARTYSHLRAEHSVEMAKRMMFDAV
jgi:integrase